MNLFFNLKKEEFKYGSGRKRTLKTFLSSLISVFGALIVALIIAATLGYNPWEIFTKLFSIGWEDPSYLFYKIGVYSLAGFAFFFAWKCGILNIGISGQMLAAGCTIVLITNAFPQEWLSSENSIWMQYGLGQLLILLIAMIVGASVALIVGVLEKYLKVNAVVSAILLNWAIYFITFFILAEQIYDPSSTNPLSISKDIPNQFRLFDTLGNTGAIIPTIVIVTLIATILFVIFKFTVFGHKIKSIGLSSTASKFAGYNIGKLSLVTFAISGALAGILACVNYTSVSPSGIPLSLTLNIVPGEGFSGIMIALVGANNPLGIIMASFIFGLFDASAIGLQTDASFNSIITGLVMLGAACSVLIIKWKPWIKFLTYKYGVNYATTASIFDNKMDSLISKYESIYSGLKKEFKHSQKEIHDRYYSDKERFKEDEEYKVKFLNEIDVVADHFFEAKEKAWNDYLKEKAEIVLENQYLKMKDRINNTVYTKENIELKSAIINNKYNNMLTKKVNSLKEKTENKENYLLSKLKNAQAKYENDMQNTSIDKVVAETTFKEKENEINEAIKLNNDKCTALINLYVEKNESWKKAEIDRMIKKQNKYITNEDKYKNITAKLNVEINEIESLKYQEELRELVKKSSLNVNGGID